MTKPSVLVEQLQQLHNLLKQQVEMFAQLNTLLDQERSALEERDLDRIRVLTSEKHTTLSSIFDSNQEKVQLLEAIGVEGGKESFMTYLHSLPDAIKQRLLKQQTLLEQALESSQKKSAINEQIVARCSHNVTQLIALLQGQQNKDRIYDPVGGAGHYRAQSRLGKA